VWFYEEFFISAYSSTPTFNAHEPEENFVTGASKKTSKAGSDAVQGGGTGERGGFRYSNVSQWKGYKTVSKSCLKLFRKLLRKLIYIRT